MSIKLIAEIGINHNGDVSLAHKMIDSAKESGADIVKFQTHIPSREMVKDLYKYVSVLPNLYQIIESFSLLKSDMIALKSHADDLGIEFMSTPFSVEAVDELEEIGVKRYKIGSGEATNFLLLNKVCNTGKEVLISTGMNTKLEVNDIVDFLRKRRYSKFVIMQCTSHYPCAYDKVNLNVLSTYRQEYSCNVGLSDHTPGIYVPVASVAFGVSYIEKHFTTSRDLAGPDQSASMNPLEFREMTDAVRIAEQAMGSSTKGSVVIDEPVRSLFFHGLVTRGQIKKGDVFSLENLTAKRPCDGIPSKEFESIIGKMSTMDLDDDTIIRTSYIG